MSSVPASTWKRPRLGDLQVRYALRVTEDKKQFGWTPVRGRRLFIPGWFNFPLFIYRDDLVCFVVHEPTGQTIAVGPDQNSAKDETNALLADKDKKQFFDEVWDSFKKLNTTPNPKPTYDIRTASETPRAKAPRRAGRHRKLRALQSVLPVQRDSLQEGQGLPPVPLLPVVGEPGGGNHGGGPCEPASVSDSLGHGPEN